MTVFSFEPAVGTVLVADDDEGGDGDLAESLQWAAKDDLMDVADKYGQARTTGALFDRVWPRRDT
jgi:hypothetical protein